MALFLHACILLIYSRILHSFKCISALHSSEKGTSFHFVGELTVYLSIDKFFACRLDKLLIDLLMNFSHLSLMVHFRNFDVT